MSERIDLFKLGMRRLAAGVSLITTRDGSGRPHGMIATSVTSVCLEPPSLLACINKSASSHDVLVEAGVFCVNLLAEDADEVALRFSSSKFRDLRFAEGGWSALETGAPALDGAIASFDCRVTNSIEASSHTIFIGEVVAVRLPPQATAPLLYLDGAFARCARAA
ncbi:MAG: flavin reductase family protein [Mesorhizobium sp.]|nr:flavin reductase family protein [Mesorhizobium sp.]MCO5160960.1 flavin reductase family protein [Mesorhizobium sp.]